MKNHGSARVITDIVRLSEGLPVGRTPLKQLVTTKACDFKEVPSSSAPSGKLARANLLDLCTLPNTPKSLKSKSIKVVKRHSRQLVTLLYSDEMRQLCRQQRHVISLSRVVRWKTRRLGLISFSISSMMFIESGGGGGSG